MRRLSCKLLQQTHFINLICRSDPFFQSPHCGKHYSTKQSCGQWRKREQCQGGHETGCRWGTAWQVMVHGNRWQVMTMTYRIDKRGEIFPPSELTPLLLGRLGVCIELEGVCERIKRTAMCGLYGAVWISTEHHTHRKMN